MANIYTLFELNEYIRRILALNLPDAIWIRAEIAQIKQNRGHYFFTLIQKEENGETILAQSEAVIWERTFRRIRRQGGKIITEILQPGLSVKILAKVDFNERYGLKLIVEDLDPSYTLGAMELQKRASLERLQKEGLLQLNKGLPLQPVLQRIVILSSPEAAGLQDFLSQLTHNPYGYSFDWRLFPIAVQGQHVLPDLKKQLKKIQRQIFTFDCIALIRGGGSRMDLAAFDQYEVCAALARCPLPLLSGLGHEIDETLTDRLANKSLKTPTAAADFLINHNLRFENRLNDLAYHIQNRGLQELSVAGLRLSKMEQNLFFLCQRQMEREKVKLAQLQQQTSLSFFQQLESARQAFQQLDAAIEMMRPETLLRRGYSLTYVDGKLLRSVEEVRADDQLTTQLADGKLESRLLKTEKK